MTIQEIIDKYHTMIDEWHSCREAALDSCYYEEELYFTGKIDTALEIIADLESISD